MRYWEKMTIPKARQIIREYVEANDFLAVAYDGCHKLFLLETEDEISKFQGLGYTITRLADMKNPAAEVSKMYVKVRKFCPLVYVCWADYSYIMPQW